MEEDKDKKEIEIYKGANLLREKIIYKSKGMIVSELKDSYIARIHISPEAKNNIKFKARKNSLEVSISKKAERNGENDGYFFMEIMEGGVSSEVYFGKGVDVDKVKSDYSNNIMTIIMPKKK